MVLPLCLFTRCGHRARAGGREDGHHTDERPLPWSSRRGRITCESEVLDRSTRRTATAEAKVRDAEGNLVALDTGAFCVFEKKGSAIV